MIKFKYQTKKNISFDLSFNKPEIVLITGENGSGKTHLLKTLAGIIKNNTVNYSENITPLVNYISYVSDKLINCDYQVEQLIHLVHPKINNYLFLNPELLKSKFSTLSSGQKKSIQIFLGLAHKPKILLLDEPENNLDEVNFEIFSKFLLEYSKENLIMIASHNPEIYKYEREIKLS